MSEEPEITRDDPLIAAEWSLGLLEGEELLAARGRYASDPSFAWRKDWWDNWFAPLTDEIAGAEPGPQVWSAITARIAAAPTQTSADRPVADLPALSAASAEVAALTRRMRRWQWAAGVTSAAAAVLLALLAFGPGGRVAGPSPDGAAPALAAAPLVATVPIGAAGLRLDVTYIPDSERMLIGAVGLSADGVHDHELWLVPEDGAALVSLGVISPGEVRSMDVPADIASQVRAGAGLLLTREPLGGKPADAKAGPVVAEGAFSRV